VLKIHSFNKLKSASTTSSILALNLLQAFATVFLARDPITSLIFEICCEAVL
jgi:hypothetical protein